MKVSVALCTYNGARHLSAQLRSIAVQSRRPDELVISDDGSTDDTLAVVEAFGRTAPFSVRLHRQNVNLGVTQNFAFALGACQGEYIALCDQDDVWLPHKLETAVSCLERDPAVQVAFSDATLADDALRPLARTLWQAMRLRRRERACFRAGRGLELLFSRTLVTGAATVLKAGFRDQLLPIPAVLPTPILHDGWLALLAAARCELALIPEPLFVYRQHSRQQVGVVAERPVPGPWRRLRNGWAVRQRRAAQRRKAIDETLDRAVILRDLLLTRIGAGGAWLRTWDEGIAYLRTRREMPTTFWGRLRTVGTETWMGRYARFAAQPVLDSFRDLAYPTTSIR